jgi:hypothetical protein
MSLVRALGGAVRESGRAVTGLRRHHAADVRSWTRRRWTSVRVAVFPVGRHARHVMGAAGMVVSTTVAIRGGVTQGSVVAASRPCVAAMRAAPRVGVCGTIAVGSVGTLVAPGAVTRVRMAAAVRLVVSPAVVRLRTGIAELWHAPGGRCWVSCARTTNGG